jgi:aspartyl-tRNA(Asn)/glutamyl-tRNA(Gln) amidotransferase subunit B
MLDSIKKDLPELPPQIRARLAGAGVQVAETDTLIGNPELLALYEAAMKHRLDSAEQRRLVNWLVGPVRGRVADTGYEPDLIEIDGKMLATFAKAVSANDISQTAAKEEILKFIDLKAYEVPDIDKAVASRRQVSDTGELTAIVQKVIQDNPKAAEDYKSGQTAAMGFLVGQIMKQSHGQANPAMVNDILKKELGG